MTKTETNILTAAAKTGTFSTTIAGGRGYGSRVHGIREYNACQKLVDKGIAIETHRTADRETTSSKCRHTWFVTVTIKILD